MDKESSMPDHIKQELLEKRTAVDFGKFLKGVVLDFIKTNPNMKPDEIATAISKLLLDQIGSDSKFTRQLDDIATQQKGFVEADKDWHQEE